MATLTPPSRITVDQVQEEVDRLRTASAAGRELFAESRKRRKSVNDEDRLRKYLARFDLDWCDSGRRVGRIGTHVVSESGCLYDTASHLPIRRRISRAIRAQIREPQRGFGALQLSTRHEASYRHRIGAATRHEEPESAYTTAVRRLRAGLLAEYSRDARGIERFGLVCENSPGVV